MSRPDPSPELLEREAAQIELSDVYAAAVMRACARAWRNERKDHSNG